MKRIFIFLHLFFSLILHAQVLPLQGDQLNYTQVMFEYPDYEGAVYHLQVFDETDSTAVQKVIDTLHTQNAIIITVPNFGKKYRWYYSASKGKNILYKSSFMHFSTGYSPLVDSAYMRVLVKKAAPHQKGIVFLDGLRIAIDRKGKPVWYMEYKSTDIQIRDINFTPSGTITFLDKSQAIETNLQGKIIWEAPDPQTTKYHHDFNKLRNGNYMICGKRELPEEEPVKMAGPSLMHQQRNLISSESIFEFDQKGKLIWEFNLNAELKKSFPTTFNSKTLMTRLGHLNGIVLDEKKQIVYASFKNFSNVFKIDKKTNIVQCIFGHKDFNLTDSVQHSNFFASQHCPILLSNGNLMVFNNNAHHHPSGIVEMKNGPLQRNNEKIWEINIAALDTNSAHTDHMGSVQEIAGEHFLIGAGQYNNTVFEVNRDKKLLWEIVTESNTAASTEIKDWTSASHYRVFYTSSLYPFYFTLRSAYSGNILSFDKLDKSIKIMIDNTGSEADSYLVTLENKGSNAQAIETIIASKQSKTVILSVPNNLHKGDNLSIKVTSQNSNIVKLITYQIQ